MPEPITASVLAGIIAQKAAEKVGERLGVAISNAIFGEDSELAEIQAELRRMSQQLEQILSYSKATFILVERLPGAMLEISERQALFEAHTNIQSTYDTYLKWKVLNDDIKALSEIALRNNWAAIIEKEWLTDKLIMLPKYGDFLQMFIGVGFRHSVLDGIGKKIGELEEIIKSLTDKDVTPCALSMEQKIRSPLVKEGSLLDAYPWVKWVLSDSRTKIVKVCEQIEGEGAGPHRRGGQTVCHNTTVLDDAWSSSLGATNAELNELSQKMEGLRKVLQAAVIVHSTLVIYRNKVMNSGEPEA